MIEFMCICHILSAINLIVFVTECEIYSSCHPNSENINRGGLIHIGSSRFSDSITLVKFVLLKLTHDLVSVLFDITALSKSVFFPFHKKDDGLKKERSVSPKHLNLQVCEQQPAAWFLYADALHAVSGCP